MISEILKRYREYKRRLGKSLLPATALSLLLLSPFANALESIPYYGETFYQRVSQGARDAQLVQLLRQVLVSRHVIRKGTFDEISPSCDPMTRDCYGHSPIGYKTARRVLMGELFLVKTENAWGIKEVYCQRLFKVGAVTMGAAMAPGEIPRHTAINIEHTWPQSRFNPKMDKQAQKADLHHLFPTDSEINRQRGNLPFADVDLSDEILHCPTSKLGSVRGSGGTFFEPPRAHKGNVARALFYFAVRYEVSIDPIEEGFLRQWTKIDPVDDEERTRNERIQKIQGNRNPFVDFPELADSIADF